VIELVFRRKIPESIDEALVFKLIKAGFGTRRKSLLNALAEGFEDELSREELKRVFAKAGLEERVRAEALMLKDFLRLAEKVSESNVPSSPSSRASFRHVF